MPGAVRPTGLSEIRCVRLRMQLSQPQFAERLGISAETYRAWDSGPAMQVEIVSVALSPLEYWTFTSHPVERNARQEVRQALLPGEPFINGIAWLGENFPQGLAALGAEAVPPALLEELYRRQAFYYAANPDDAAGVESVSVRFHAKLHWRMKGQRRTQRRRRHSGWAPAPACCEPPG